MASENDQVIQLLGELKGELKGMRDVITANHESAKQRTESNHIAVNQRLTDMQEAMGQRLDAVEKRIEHVEVEQKNIIWKVASWSSLGGAIVAGGIELIKHASK